MSKIKRKLHTLKLSVDYCFDVTEGLKNFEIRKNDRDFKVDDFIEFIPVNAFGQTIEDTYGFSNRLYRITYILDNSNYLKKGYVALGIKETNDIVLVCADERAYAIGSIKNE